MFLRVAVDVSDERQQVVVAVNGFAPEGGFKEDAGAAGGVVEGTGVGDEHVVEGAAGFLEFKDWSILGEWSNLGGLHLAELRQRPICDVFAAVVAVFVVGVEGDDVAFVVVEVEGDQPRSS